MVEVFTHGISVDYENPGEQFPLVTVTFAVTATDHLPSIDDLAQGLIMLGKMTDNESAFEEEARKWLEREKAFDKELDESVEAGQVILDQLKPGWREEESEA